MPPDLLHHQAAQVRPPAEGINLPRPGDSGRRVALLAHRGAGRPAVADDVIAIYVSRHLPHRVLACDDVDKVVEVADGEAELLIGHGGLEVQHAIRVERGETGPVDLALRAGLAVVPPSKNRQPSGSSTLREKEGVVKCIASLTTL